MHIWNLYILHKIKPLWLQKTFANILGFLIIYPVLLYNQESALLLSLFLAVFLYRKLKREEILKKYEYNNLAISHFLASIFCACLFIFDTQTLFVMHACFGIIFLRIYDFYKPSIIGRPHHFTTNLEFGKIAASILQGILSGLSVMLLHSLFLKFPHYSPYNLIDTLLKT